MKKNLDLYKSELYSSVQKSSNARNMISDRIDKIETSISNLESHNSKINSALHSFDNLDQIKSQIMDNEEKNSMKMGQLKLDIDAIYQELEQDYVNGNDLINFGKQIQSSVQTILDEREETISANTQRKLAELKNDIVLLNEKIEKLSNVNNKADDNLDISFSPKTPETNVSKKLPPAFSFRGTSKKP